MFGISVKSVPGCLVLIDPSRIGVPVALTPGLGPQDETLADEPPPELLAAELELPPELPPELLLLLLLPHPARANNPIAANSAIPTRTRGMTW
jgi:hypothetical protein